MTETVRVIKTDNFRTELKVDTIDPLIVTLGGRDFAVSVDYRRTETPAVTEELDVRIPDFSLNGSEERGLYFKLRVTGYDGKTSMRVHTTSRIKSGLHDKELDFLFMEEVAPQIKRHHLVYASVLTSSQE